MATTTKPPLGIPRITPETYGQEDFLRSDPTLHEYRREPPRTQRYGQEDFLRGK